MTKTKPFLVPVILMAGLVAACGQGTANAENEAAQAPETQTLPENAVAPDASANAAEAANPAPAETTAAPAPEAAASTVSALPLKRGYYVRAETPCNRASRADVFSLLTRTGTNLNCTFKKIERTGATTYRVTEECSHGGAAWGRPDETETTTSTYEIPNETSYRVTYEGGSEASARYCAQSSMGPEYRDNDISDVTG